MAQGEYVFDDCVPNARIIIAQIQGDADQNRDWSFAANVPPRVQRELDNGVFRASAIARGVDGRLYDGDGNFLAQCPEWLMALDPDTSQYRAAGQFFQWTLINSASAVITMRETVYKDASLLMKVLTPFLDPETPPNVSLSFMGILRSRG